MPNNPPGDRPPRKKGPRRAPSSDQQPRQPRPGDRPRSERQGGPGGHGGDRQGGGPRMGGERQNSPRGGRMSREEIEWVRDLWQHKEPVDEIAQQLGAPQAEIEALIAGWENR